MKTYWLYWQFKDGKFELVEWQSNNEYAEIAASVFWPSISIKQAQESALLECHQTRKQVEMECSKQCLPNLDLSRLPFTNTHIVAIPRNDDLYGNFIECVYTVEE